MLATFEPDDAVTTTLAVPAVPDGVVAVTDVSLTETILVAAAPPIVTPVTPVKPVPVIVTRVPPMVGPAVGEMESMAGAGAAASATTGIAQAKNTAKNMRQI